MFKPVNQQPFLLNKHDHAKISSDPINTYTVLTITIITRGVKRYEEP